MGEDIRSLQTMFEYIVSRLHAGKERTSRRITFYNQILLFMMVVAFSKKSNREDMCLSTPIKLTGSYDVTHRDRRHPDNS